MKTDLRSSFPVAGMSLAALLAQSGTAQQADDDAQPMLEEIVVTAQKRSQSIQDVPVAMTAFGGEALEDNGAVNLEDLSGIAPNVQLTQMAIIPNVGSFTIRGINFTDPDPNADPKTGVSLDGVPLTRNNGLLMDMFDIESVEVLRGPQGTLYGRNNMAGTIKLVSARPTEQAGGKVKATVGDYGQQILRAVLNSGSFADGRLRAKVAVSDREFDGQHENLFTGTELGAQEARGGRATVSYEGDGFDVTVIADTVEEEFTGPATSSVLNDPGGIGRDGDEYEVHQDVDGYSDFDTWGLTFQANRELDAGTFTLVAGHRELEYETFGDFDGYAGATDRPRMLPPPFSFFQAFHVRRIAEHDQQTVELRFADAHSDRFDYVVGLFPHAGGVHPAQLPERRIPPATHLLPPRRPGQHAPDADRRTGVREHLPLRADGHQPERAVRARRGRPHQPGPQGGRDHAAQRLPGRRRRGLGTSSPGRRA